MKKIIFITFIIILLMGCSCVISESHEIAESSVVVDTETMSKPILVSVRMDDVEAYKIIDSGFKAAVNKVDAEYTSVVFSADDIDYSIDPHCKKVKEFLDSVNDHNTAAFCYNFKDMDFQDYFQYNDIFCSEVSDGYVNEYSYVDVLAYTPSLSNIYNVAVEYIANSCSENDICGFAYMTSRAVEEESYEFFAINEMIKQLTGKVGVISPCNIEYGVASETQIMQLIDYVEQNNITVLFCSRLISVSALNEIKQTYPDVKIIYANTLFDGINSVIDGTVEIAVDIPLYDIGYETALELINCINGVDFKNNINIEPYCISSKEEAQKYLNKIMQDYPSE